MDPKQTEGQVPGGQSSMPPSSSTLSTGANVSRTMESLNGNDSATSKSVFDNHRFDKVAPQTGDIIIPQDKKPQRQLDPNTLRRYAIFAGIGLTIVAFIAIIVVAIINLNKNDDNTNTSSKDPIAAQEAFEKYMNTIVFGNEDMKQYIDDDGNTHELYEMLESIEMGAAMDVGVLYADDMLSSDPSSERTTYFEVLDGFFTDFEENYTGDYVDDLHYLKTYFHDFATVSILSEDFLLDYFSKNGFDTTQSYITSTLSTDLDDHAIFDYTSYYLTYALAYLNLLNEAQPLGCIQNGILLEACVIESFGNYPVYLESSNDVFRAARNIRLSARNSALDVLCDIYFTYHDDLLPEDDGGRSSSSSGSL